MDRQVKIEKRKKRKHERSEKRRSRYLLKMNKLRTYMNKGLSLGEARQYARYGSFYRDGREMQICSWEGICSSPCNGDC